MNEVKSTVRESFKYRYFVTGHFNHRLRPLVKDRLCRRIRSLVDDIILQNILHPAHLKVIAFFVQFSPLIYFLRN